MTAAPFPETLPAFQRMFPDEAACTAYLEALRWPAGFSCLWAGCRSRGDPFRFTKRPSVLRCRKCERNTSITAGTIMHATRVPLQIWFWGAYLVTTQTPGMSALQFQRQLGITRYETAFQLLHKLRTAMVRPDRDRIGSQWPVEIDETYVGAATRGKGRGVHEMAIVVGAVEARKQARKGRKRHAAAGRLRLGVVPDRSSKALTKFVTDNVERRSHVTTDGWQGYDRLDELGYDHDSLALGGDPVNAELALPTIHQVFANLKVWLNGTHHGVSDRHLPAYLNEYVFRFNRRFYPMTAFRSVLGIGTQVAGRTYAALYDHKQKPSRKPYRNG